MKYEKTGTNVPRQNEYRNKGMKETKKNQRKIKEELKKNGSR